MPFPLQARRRALAAAATLALAGTALAPAAAQSLSNVSFVNGLAIAGDSLDLSSGSSFDRRVGFFSDIYYDRARNEWWGLSDRGPGGGTLNYETRIQRFTLDVNAATGAISNFQVVQTIKFSSAGAALNGLAPAAPGSALGLSFDPEGMVVNPKNGNLLVSDEYGPSLYEFNRSGSLVKTYTVPSNLVPKVGSTVNYNGTPTQLTSGREGNRGLEGLAISPDGHYAYAMLQDGTVVDGNLSGGSLTRSFYTRIVKYDTATGQAVGQYAYKLDRNGQGQGISALVALGNDKFLVLERNNRGVSTEPTNTVGGADKSIYQIDLAGASDITDLELPHTNTGLPAGYTAVAKSAEIPRSVGQHLGRTRRQVAREVGRPGRGPAAGRWQLPGAGRHRQRLQRDAKRQRHAVRCVVRFFAGQSECRLHPMPGGAA